MIPFKTIPEIQDEGEQWSGWIQVQYTWYTIRTFVNATMYLHIAQQLKKNLKNTNAISYSSFRILVLS
jgi:hypothetical protein